MRLGGQASLRGGREELRAVVSSAVNFKGPAVGEFSRERREAPRGRLLEAFGADRSTIPGAEGKTKSRKVSDLGSILCRDDIEQGPLSRSKRCETKN